MSKKKISKSVWLIVVLLLAAAVAAGIGWRYMSPTRIALVNYPEYVIAPLLEGEPDFFVRPEVMKWTETSGPELKKFDAIYFFGMGLKFTPRQEVLLKELAAAKVPLYVTASTRRWLPLIWTAATGRTFNACWIIRVMNWTASGCLPLRRCRRFRRSGLPISIGTKRTVLRIGLPSGSITGNCPAMRRKIR